MPTHIRRRETEPAHRVLGVEYFAARDSPAQKRLGSLATVEDVSFEPGLCTVPPHSQLHAQASGPPHEERQIETKDVVVLERVGIPLAHDLDKAREQLRFAERRRVKALAPSAAVP